MLKVRFSNFWPDFVASESLFYFCLLRIVNSPITIITDPTSNVDIEFESVYPNVGLLEHLKDRILMQRGSLDPNEYAEKYRFRFRRRSLSARRRVWYTAENLRSPHDVYDLTISFDVDDSNFRNVYFPFWMYRLNWGLGNRLTEMSPSPEELITPRKPQFSFQFDKACTFSSTKDPNRLRLHSSIERHMSLDRFGSAFGYRVDSKLNIASKYKYQVCAENSVTPGYVTEKLQEAWVARNIPIWEGMHLNNQFNPNAYLDVTNLNSDEITEKLACMNNEKAQWMVSQPLLNYAPTLDQLLLGLRTVLDL